MRGGQVVRLADDLKLDKRIKHNIEIVIDRLTIEPKVRTLGRFVRMPIYFQQIVAGSRLPV